MSDKAPNVKLILDTRSQKVNISDPTKPLFPVKLYVYDPLTRKGNRYGTILAFTEEEFESIWLTVKPRKQNQELRAKLQSLLDKTKADLESIETFTFAEFEKTLSRKTTDKNNVYWNYQNLMNEKRGLDSISNLDLYKYSLKSIKSFVASQSNKLKKDDYLPFDVITVEWLKRYEAFMEKSGKSKTTTSIYLKPLQAVFNSAGINYENPKYPFGAGKFQIDTPDKTNKVLTVEELKTLLNSDPISKDQQKAKDFFFFSYFSNGMNVKDILMLRYDQIINNEFSFIRSKTNKRGRKNPQAIHVVLNDFTKMVIREYGNTPNGRSKQLVFNVLDENDTEEARHRKIKIFTRYMNQHLKKLATALNITSEISTYYARHSFATGLIRNGLPIAFIQESLGHSDAKTTQRYLAGFESKTRKDAAAALYHNLIS